MKLILKTITTFASLALAHFCIAGTYTFVSVETFVPLGGWDSGTNCTTSNSSKTATITEAGSLYASGPSVNLTKSLYINPLLKWKIKWTPDYVGEPRPESAIGIAMKKHRRQGGISVAAVSISSSPTTVESSADIQVSDTNISNTQQAFSIYATSPGSYPGANPNVNLGDSSNDYTVESEQQLAFGFIEENNEWVGIAYIQPAIFTQLNAKTSWSGNYWFGVPQANSGVDINLKYTYDRIEAAP